VDACLSGDETAARQFVERFQGRVFGLCWRMLHHQQDAEDAAQDAFVRALRSLGQWDRQRPLEPWLITIAANRCRTVLARRNRHPVAVPLMAGDVTTASDELQAAQQLAEEVRQALDAIHPQHAHAFRLFHEQELSYAEIAEQCERPIGTIKTWVHRARRGIVERLSQRGVIDANDERMQPNRATTQRVAG
jgi:RNA polymerase sigma-70 factor (ECF subfamily)